MKESKGKRPVTEDTIERIFSRMISAFGASRVEVPSQQTKATWVLLLRDRDEVSVLAATMDLLSEPREWPPTPGQVRDRAVDIARGELNPLSPTEAWERVLATARGEVVELTEKENRALKVSGGTWAIKNSSSVESARSVFLKHYGALCQSEKRMAVTIPEVARTANLALPALPEKRIQEDEQLDRNRATPEQVSKFLDSYVFRQEMLDDVKAR